METVVAADELGYDYCLLADEGFMPDVYVDRGARRRASSWDR